MRVAIFSLMAGALGCAAFAAPAAAYDYPYCLQSRSTGVPGDCNYQSYAQCVVSASGRGASCNVNPRVAFGRAPGGRLRSDAQPYGGEQRYGGGRFYDRY